MRIAIDARELGGRPTGVGRYLREILAAWSALPAASAHEFVLCAAEAIDLAPFTGLRVSTAIRPGSGTIWEQAVLPGLVRGVRPDVLFSPAYTAPLLARVPSVVAIHDVSFAAHPEWFTWREGTRRRLLARLSARRARRVLTISNFSKREITTHLGVEAERIAVIPPGLTRHPYHQAIPEQAVGVPEQPSVLYVGSIFARRHVPELIDGFARLGRGRPDLHLDIVGDNRTVPAVDFDAVAARTGLRDRIHLRSYVTDEELTRLYRRASAFAFLSDYEGFGLTPLEALGAGIPILVLDTAVAREIYGDAAAYVARPDPALIADALERLIFEPAERRTRLEAAASVLPRYRWDACAEGVLRELVGAA